MGTWLDTASRAKKERKPNRKNRRSRPAARSKFDSLFQVERLEDRVLLTIDSPAIVATINNPEPFNFSGPVATFTSADSSFSAAIDWGDGSTSTVTSAGGSITETGGVWTVAGTHSYTDEIPGSNNLVATITDLTDSTTNSATGTATITEGDTLTAVGSVSISATEGSTFSSTAVATFTTSYAANPASDFTATINWGDGSSSTVTPTGTGNGTLTVAGSHVYTDELSSAPASVDLIEDTPGNAAAIASGTATVTEADKLTAGAAATLTGTQGAAVSSSTLATFTVSGFSANTASDFTATVNWGDSTTSTLSGNAITESNGTLTVSGSHAYAATGTHAVTVTLADNSPGTATATDTGSASITAAPSAAPNVSVTKTGPSTVVAGDTVTYTVTLTNSSAANAATNVAFTDQLDPNELFFSASDTAGTPLTLNASTGQVTGTVASLGTSSTDTVTIVAVVPNSSTPPTSVTDTASIAIPSGNAATTISASKTTTVTAPAATADTVGVFKTQTSPAGNVANAGDKITYSVQLFNFGATAATNVSIADQLDPNEVLFSVSDTAGTTFNVVNGVITGTVGSIAAGSADTVTIRVSPAVAGKSITDTAVIGAAGGNFEQAPPVSSVTTAIGAAGTGTNNVSVTKTGPTATSISVGAPVTYTIALKNNAAAAASNVWIIDPIGSNEAVLSASDTAGSRFNIANGEVTANVSSIAAGGTDTATIVLVPTATGTVANTAFTGIGGGNQSSNSSSATSITATAAASTAPSLQVTKTGPTTANVGALVTDTVTISNVSTANAATNVQFVDSFNDLAIFSVSDSAGTAFKVANGAISGTIAGIAAGGTDTITIVAIPLVAGTASDPIVLGVAGGNAGTVKTNANNTTVNVAPNTAANVSVAKTVSAIPASPGTVGDVVTETITVTNNGASAATNVAVMDTLPSQELLLSVTDTSTPANTFALNTATNAVSGTIATIAAGATDTVTVKVVPTAAGIFPDTATIGIAGGNQGAISNFANATVNAAAPAGPSVTVLKTAPATAAIGSVVTDTITLTNAAGAGAATNLQFVDTLGTNVSGVTSSVGTYNTATGQVTGTVASLGAGASTTITVSFTATAAGALADTATIAVPGGNAGATISSSATTSVSGVTVNKSVPGTSTVGSVLTETITVANSGSTAATNVAFSDSLGTSGYNFVSASDTAGTALSFSGGKLTGTIASLAASGADTVTVRLIPTAAGTLSDTASVTANGATTTATASSTASAGSTPANVSISKSAAKNGTVGDVVSDTITLTNAGTAATPAGGVTLYDTLGPNQSFISASDTAGSAFSFDAATNTVIGFMSSIAASGTDTVTINVVPTSGAGGGTITDTANVAVSGGNSATTITATGSTTVAAAGTTKVNVAKTAPATANVGSVVTETVTITNAGSSAATNVAFTDNFFAGNVTLVSASDTAGSKLAFNSNTDTITGTIASIASGTSGNVDTVTVTYIPLTAGTVTDTAAIAVSGGNSGTSSSSASTTVNAAPSTAPTIAIAKSSPATAPVGSLLTTTVTLTNNTSPAAAATNVAFVDQLSPGQTFISASDTGGNSFTLSNGQVTGTIATIGTGASNTDTITIVSLVTGAAGSTTGDTAIIGVSGGNQSAPSVSKTATVGAGTANVSVSKSAPATGSVGTAITDTVTLNNKGSAAVTNVSFIDALPGNVSNVSASDAAGDKFTFANGQLTGTIASVATGTSTVSVVYTPTAAGAFADTASIGIAAGNTGTLSATASTTVGQPASLTIAKTGTPSTVAVGGSETYTITVINSGGAAATGATVTDTLPAGLTLVSATDTSGTVTTSGNTVTDALGSIAANTGLETLTIIATANALPSGTTSTTVTNTATLSFNSTTQTASATTTIGTTPIVTGIGFLAGQPGDATIQTFVHNLYRELLGREPDSAGQTFWVSYLTAHNNAAGRNQVIQGFLNSQEYAIHYITTLYETLLGRAPDAPGLQFWTQKMGQPGTVGGHGGSADEKFIVAAFLGSDEFYIKAGNTPQTWINAVYEDVFGRAADGQGMAFWTNELQTRGASDRDGIIRDLLTSPEASHDLLDSFYPAAGGTSSNPLPTPGSPAAPAGSIPLAVITGLGWENLYLEGPYGNSQQGNDGFYSALAGNGAWDDVQLLLLESNQYYSNPNRPVTH